MSASPNTLPIAASPRQSKTRIPAELYLLALFLLLAGSILPELLWGGPYTQVAQVAFLLLATLLCRLMPRWQAVWGFACMLLIVNASFLLSGYVRSQAWWSGAFWWAGDLSEVASNVAAKMIGVVPVAGALLALLGTRERAYLLPGDLARKAEPIPWLGIRGGEIAWGRLAVIAGLLITLGTALLAMLTTTGFALPAGMSGLLRMLPLVIVLALVNSFCEGLVFRNSIMAPLRDGFGKLFVLILPALLFGIAHTQGVPGGILGGAMSAFLGYFMCLSIYETDGFIAGWFIHFLQDVTIFSLLVVLA